MIFQPDEEPLLDLNNPDVQSRRESIVKWIEWAKDTIVSLRNRYEKAYDDSMTQRHNISRLEKDLKLAKEDCQSYERVLSKRKELTIYEVGQKVFIGPEYIAAEVLAVTIGRVGTYYKVGYWLGGSYLTVVLPDNEVCGEPPLLPTTENRR